MKNEKEKVEDVVIYIGLMEWNAKQEDLKVKRGMGRSRKKVEKLS